MTVFIKSRYFFILALCVMCSLLLSACSEEEPQDKSASAPPPPKVEVATPLIKEIIEWDEYTGRFEAVERVDISARISGYLSEIRFTDGEYVDQGDILFVIDQRPLKIAYDRAEAQFELARKELERARNLRADKAISQEQVDRRIQEFRLARAAMDEARLNLDYSTVKAPVSGRIGEARVDRGNLISGGEQNPTILTTIVSVDPIHFYFDTSESKHLKYLRLDRDGKRPGSDRTANPILVRLADEDDYTHLGKMNFVDNVVDRGTGTVEARAIFDNPDGFIYPGLFGRARVIASPKYEALLIPDEAVLSQQTRKLVLTLGPDNKATPKYVELGPLRDSGLRVIRSGLDPSDKVIVNGMAKARPGSKVTPSETEITEGKVTSDMLPSPDQLRPEYRQGSSDNAGKGASPAAQKQKQPPRKRSKQQQQQQEPSYLSDPPEGYSGQDE